MIAEFVGGPNDGLVLTSTEFEPGMIYSATIGDRSIEGAPKYQARVTLENNVLYLDLIDDQTRRRT